MTSFEDLYFISKVLEAEGKEAVLYFPNNYGVSVITKSIYQSGDRDNEYELVVLHAGMITYDTPVTSDVEANLSPDEVTELMKRVETLPWRAYRGMTVYKVDQMWVEGATTIKTTPEKKTS